MKRIIFLLLCGMLPFMVAAQATRPVRGVVFNAQGVPMPGVTLTAVGSQGTAISANDGTFEMMVSPYTKFIEASMEGFISAQAEVDGSYLVFKLAVDKKYLENKAKAEEAARLEAEAKAKAEEEARLAEERRIAAEKAAAEKAEAARIAAEEKKRLEEEKRIAAEKAAAEKAEAARLAAEEKARIAEEKRIAAEKAAAEKARIAEEKKRLEEEKRLAAERAAAEKAERERLAMAEQNRLAQQTAAETARLAEVDNAREAEAKRIAAEKVAAAKQMKLEAREAKAEPWKEAKLKGYRSYVEAAFAIDFNLMPSYNVHYIGGYQINNQVYIGLGTGVSIDGDDGRNESELVGGNATNEVTNNGGEYLHLNLLNVPVFAYFRANFVDRRCSPFFALSAGYRLSSKRRLEMPFQNSVVYGTSGFFATPQLGVDFRMNKKSSFYLSAGFNIEQKPFMTEYSVTSVKYQQKLMYGIKLTLGFTF
ncbi:MAG: hypothetical protein IKY24_05995 [Alistipes sp.]|nr:hypothetical protein [Alistipes sp.]